MPWSDREIDEVEMLDGERRIVGDRVQVPVSGRPGLKGGRLFGGFVEFATLQHRVQALNGGNNHLGSGSTRLLRSC